MIDGRVEIVVATISEVHMARWHSELRKLSHTVGHCSCCVCTRVVVQEVCTHTTHLGAERGYNKFVSFLAALQKGKTQGRPT